MEDVDHIKIFEGQELEAIWVSLIGEQIEKNKEFAYNGVL